MKTPTLIFSFLFLLFSFVVKAQDKSTLELKAYGDVYYGFYPDNSFSGLQTYSTSSPRNSIGLNNLQLGLHYTSKDIRSSMTLHHGDIAQATWDNTFDMVQEANVGVQLFTDWWLDAGLFRTHIGTESFLPKNNDLSIISIITYNEPFYQAGAKLAYEGSEKFDLEFWIANGYNQFIDINTAKSLGLLFTYHISDMHSVTYTNLTGDETNNGVLPATDIMRSYHNLYYNGNIKNKVKLTFGVDYGLQNNTEFTTDPSNFLAFLGTVRFIITKKSALTVRYEYFDDPSGFIGGGYFLNPMEERFSGYTIQGITGGYEYAPSESSFIRIEGRFLDELNDAPNVFAGNSKPTRMEWMINMGTFFDKKW